MDPSPNPECRFLHADYSATTDFLAEFNARHEKEESDRKSNFFPL